MSECCEAAVDYVVVKGHRWGGAGSPTQWSVRRCSFPAVGERLTDVGIPRSIPELIRVCRIHTRSRLLFASGSPP